MTAKCRLVLAVQCTVRLQICPVVGYVSAGWSLEIDLAPWLFLVGEKFLLAGKNEEQVPRHQKETFLEEWS